MKYVVVLYDGMADYPVPALGGKTPMMCAKKPNMDFLAKRSEVGLIKTVADGLKPGSDVANMSVLGFDPMKYYTGRSPLEAASIGIDMKPSDVSLRTNLVTLSEDDLPYEQKTIEDYCADDISTEEAEILIKYIDEKLGTDEFKFYPGVSYRHCLIWNNGTTDLGKMTPPHDITGKVITEYLSTSENAKPLIELMKKSYDLLKDHPVNIARKQAKDLLTQFGFGVRARDLHFHRLKKFTALKVRLYLLLTLLKASAAVLKWKLPKLRVQQDILTPILKARQKPQLTAWKETILYMFTLKLRMNAATETSRKIK